jgi:multidrug resistance efflux pump
MLQLMMTVNLAAESIGIGEIDRVPYEIKLAQANAQLESATARLVLANRELARIQMLQARQVETAENLDQRAADQRAAQAAVDDAKAQIRDAQFDLDHWFPQFSRTAPLYD